jgi:hypothetical protein
MKITQWNPTKTVKKKVAMSEYYRWGEFDESMQVVSITMKHHCTINLW